MRCRAEAPPAPPPVAALARLSLFFSTFSQPASAPAFLAALDAGGRLRDNHRRAVCVGEQRTRRRHT
jgi:hypothetical protein